MKRWIVYFLLAAMLCVLPITSKEKISIEELEPAELIYLKKENGLYVLYSDTKSVGKGKTVAEAVRHIQKEAKGKLFLETADFLLVDKTCISEIRNMASVLRPAAGVCAVIGDPDLQIAATYLRAHPLNTNIGEFLEGEVLPCICMKEGTIRVPESE